MPTAILSHPNKSCRREVVRTMPLSASNTTTRELIAVIAETPLPYDLATLPEAGRPLRNGWPEQPQHFLPPALAGFDARKVSFVEHLLDAFQPPACAKENHLRATTCGTACVRQLLAAIAVSPRHCGHSHALADFAAPGLPGGRTGAAIGSTTSKEQGASPDQQSQRTC